MRPTLILLVLACATAFAQDNSTPLPDTPQPFTGGIPQRFSNNLRQRLGAIFNPLQLQRPATATTPQPPVIATVTTPPEICSIPLLTAVAPGKPVPMPGATKRNPAQKNPGPIDHMKIVAPAPACRVTARSLPSPITAPPTRP